VGLTLGTDAERTIGVPVPFRKKGFAMGGGGAGTGEGWPTTLQPAPPEKAAAAATATAAARCDVGVQAASLALLGLVAELSFALGSRCAAFLASSHSHHRLPMASPHLCTCDSNALRFFPVCSETFLQMSSWTASRSSRKRRPQIRQASRVTSPSM